LHSNYSIDGIDASAKIPRVRVSRQIISATCHVYNVPPDGRQTRLLPLNIIPRVHEEAPPVFASLRGDSDITVIVIASITHFTFPISIDVDAEVRVDGMVIPLRPEAKIA
jgi:hypothetical protein